MNESASIRLRLGDLIHAVVKHRKLILFLTLAGLFLGIALSGLSFMRGELAKQYLLTASFTVSNRTQNGVFPGSNATYPRSEDIDVSTDMVSPVIYLMKSEKNLANTIEAMGLLGITTDNISSNLRLNQYESTNIVEISLYWRSAEEGAEILKTLIEQGNRFIAEVIGMGELTTINEPNAKYLIGGNLNASLWIIMTFFGFMAGVAFSVLRSLIQPTLTDVRDADSVLGLDTLAVIPRNDEYFRCTGAAMTDESLTGYISEEMTSAAHILRNRLGGSNKCVYFTSATREEGKSAIAAHMALALANLGFHVLLVDFDFRNPSLGNMFLGKVEYNQSFNALYHGEISEVEAVYSVNGFLDILPAIIERRSIHLDDGTIGLVKKLSENYDYVLMDTPPVGMAADAMSLNQVADSVVFVIRYDFSTISTIKEALNRLDKSGTHVSGCVINGINTKHRDYNNH